MAISTFDDPTLPVDCEDAVLPAGLARADCYAPELNFGGIVEFYFASEPFPDGVSKVPTTTEIAAHLATTPGPAKMVGPIVAGLSYAPPTDQVVRVNGVDYPRPTDLVINVLIQDTREENVEFARTTQKGGRSGYFYGVDANGNWFGGRNGLLGGRATLVLRNNWSAGEDELQTITGTVKRRGYFDSVRGVSPVPALQSN